MSAALGCGHGSVAECKRQRNGCTRRATAQAVQVGADAGRWTVQVLWARVGWWWQVAAHRSERRRGGGGGAWSRVGASTASHAPEHGLIWAARDRARPTDAPNQHCTEGEHGTPHTAQMERDSQPNANAQPITSSESSEKSSTKQEAKQNTQTVRHSQKRKDKIDSCSQPLTLTVRVAGAAAPSASGTALTAQL